jgi:hypothetical protein
VCLRVGGRRAQQFSLLPAAHRQKDRYAGSVDRQNGGVTDPRFLRAALLRRAARAVAVPML